MKRKTIALCVTGYNWEYESRVVDGVWRECLERDVNLFVFSTQMRRPELNSDRVLPESIIRGEIEIFNLINYDIIDGIVILGDSLIEESVIGDISEKAKARNIPVININDPEHITDYNIELSDKTAMEFVMRHLIDDHGVTKINFIGGFPGNLQTEERLAAYKKVLAEHNIPIEESRIGYGKFWKEAYDCTKEFMESGSAPQAIVCASDTMSFFCMDYLKEHGYKIPQDILVTGFDGIKDCEMYSPTVTTVRRSFAKAGKRAVELFTNIWAGKNPPHTVSVESELIKNESCGCKMDKNFKAPSFYEKNYAWHDKMMEFNTYIVEMNANFASARNSVELYESCIKGAQFFKLKKMFICICSDIERNNSGLRDENLRTAYKGMSDTMISMLQYGHDVPIGTEFRSAQLVPEDYQNSEKPQLYAFSPLYFKESFLGYVAYQPSTIKGQGDFFSTWMLSVANNAGSFYMKNQLEYVVSQLEDLYVRDPLTNLFNRRGMNQFGGTVIHYAKLNNRLITVICADIDNLKPINDKFGHEAGDNAISQAASAILTSMPAESVCTRTGGDEFCVILSSNSCNEIDGYIKKLDGELANYNRQSGLPYKVECSCGYHCVKGCDIETVDSLIKLADAEMYKVKAAKKTNR